MRCEGCTSTRSSLAVAWSPRSDGERDELATLVVDASGRAALGARWLPVIGFEPPETTTVNAHWGYASRFFRLPADAVPPVVGGFPLGNAGAGPPRTRGGYLLLQEDDTWLVTLSGCAKDFPPGDEEGFLAFARSLAFPHIGDAIAQAEPLSPIHLWRNTVNRRRHFERQERRPERFVPFADAACAFNPIYGQGMTIASLRALDLAAELSAGSRRPDTSTRSRSTTASWRSAATTSTCTRRSAPRTN